jgi:hypothetical protein
MRGAGYFSEPPTGYMRMLVLIFIYALMAQAVRARTAKTGITSH